jgi:hypothetical protein
MGSRQCSVGGKSLLSSISSRSFFRAAVLQTVLRSSIFASAQTLHYLDCSATPQHMDSLSPATAWNSADQANKYLFSPGDRLLLRRGSTCHGMLSPKGSGDPHRSFSIGAYGAGRLPVVIGDKSEAGLKFTDQQYLEISDIEVVGGNPYGILITGSASADLSHFRLSDLVVHGVSGDPKSKLTGLIVVAPQPGASTRFHDVIIDGITAYDTTQWAGIVVSAGIYTADSKPIRGSDVTVRNSVVHDVAGDGILLMLVKNGTLEWNVSWDTGLQYSETIGTPNGIWEWMCEECLVQFNEGFFSDSPGVDGGVFDIDYGTIKNTVQFNFGHDSQGYCVSAFGVGGGSSDSVDSVIRGNLCVGNGRSPREARRQGAMFFSTTPGGTLRGIDVYGNTIAWDPPIDAAAIVSDAAIDRSAPHAIHNNVVIARSGNLTRVTGGIELSDNEYRTLSAGAPEWQFGERKFQTLADAQASGQEKGSSLTSAPVDGLFHPAGPNCEHSKSLLEHDIYGDEMNACAGAVSHASKEGQGNSVPFFSQPIKIDGMEFHKDGWSLIARMPPEGSPGSDDSRKEMTVLKSMQEQFAPLGLHIYVISDVSLDPVAARNWADDWNFARIHLLTSPGEDVFRELFQGASLSTVLIDPEAKVQQRWLGLATFPALELTLRRILGTPVGMQTLNFDCVTSRPF